MALHDQRWMAGASGAHLFGDRYAPGEEVLVSDWDDTIIQAAIDDGSLVQYAPAAAISIVGLAGANPGDVVMSDPGGSGDLVMAPESTPKGLWNYLRSHTGKDIASAAGAGGTIVPALGPVVVVKDGTTGNPLQVDAPVGGSRPITLNAVLSLTRDNTTGDGLTTGAFIVEVTPAAVLASVQPGMVPRHFSNDFADPSNKINFGRNKAVMLGHKLDPDELVVQRSWQLVYLASSQAAAGAINTLNSSDDSLILINTKSITGGLVTLTSIVPHYLKQGDVITVQSQNAVTGLFQINNDGIDGANIVVGGTPDAYTFTYPVTVAGTGNMAPTPAYKMITAGMKAQIVSGTRLWIEQL